MSTKLKYIAWSKFLPKKKTNLSNSLRRFDIYDDGRLRGHTENIKLNCIYFSTSVDKGFDMIISKKKQKSKA